MSIEILFTRAGLELRVIAVSRTFNSGAMRSRALDNVSAHFHPGEIVGIQGPSGGGKTSFLQVIGGVERADSGQVFVGEHEVTALSDQDRLAAFRLSEVGFVFQAFNLIPGLTITENVQFPMIVAGEKSKSSAERARALLDLVGVGHKADSRPDELSGGEQQRSAIALALANDPPLILADEPTGNLDSRNSETVIGLLIRLAKLGKTVIVATHDPLVTRKVDRVLHMRDGQLSNGVEEG